MAEAGRALSRPLPHNSCLISGGQLPVFACGVDGGKPEQVPDKLDFLAERCPLYCVVSEVFFELNLRGGFRRQAVRGLGPAAAGTGAGMFRLRPVSGGDAGRGGARVGVRAIGLSEGLTRVEFDGRSQTDYLSTLEKYPAFGNRLSGAAGSLFIDGSAMKHRLRNIGTCREC